MSNMPKPEEFEDADGYIDWEDYDYAREQYYYDVPNLFEFWCPEVKVEVEVFVEPSIQDLINQLMDK